MAKRVIVTGVTGCIGRALCKQLVAKGYDVVGLSRNPHKAAKVLGEQAHAVAWDAESTEGWLRHADGAFAVINLAGENVASSPWTDEKKKEILHSRLKAARAVVEAIREANNKPKVLIQASAVGYYGDCGSEVLDESSPPGSGFLSEVTQQWEPATEAAESLGVRRVIIRTGLVLDRHHGFLPRILVFFRYFFGLHLSKGDHWLSWIHIDDEVKAILLLLERGDLQGAFNLTAPNPVMFNDFLNLLGKVMNRSPWMHVPVWLVRFFLGEMAKGMILLSQRVMPKRLLEMGYEFRYPDLQSALREILAET